ncbi:unnamed protein product [Paramecium sonneborni]|uniref:1-alkyl-2-acetylglycerophosphocholine esterase n=1 Tax=Paramecium sonneborni TaxID=65129 RepID=A0A8S1RD11_9CILI|nr:unnamed protein product [Paramecium sonneborni]
MLSSWNINNFIFYQFPKPTGKYRTCYKQIKLNDSYSTDASVYYPCADRKQEDVSYKWLPNHKFAKQLYEISILQTKWVPSEWIFDVALSFLDFITFRASEEQPLLNNELDVIIFSHGFSQHRNAYTALCQQLASEGYIVFSLQHYELVYPWDIKATKIYNTGNYPEIIEKYQKIRASHLEWRTEQISQFIQTLKTNKIKDIFFDFKPLSINLIGHSFGGASVLRIAQEIEVNSVIAYDPWLFPFTQQQMHKQLKSRTLILSKDKNRIKQEIFDPKMLKDFLEFNNQIEHYKIKSLDHIYPVDLTYIMAAEMVLFGELRNDDNIFSINNLIHSLTTKFLQQKLFSVQESKSFC